MDSLRFYRKHPGRVALLRLRDAGVWILYPWLLTELALPMQPDVMAHQPLILRVLVYLPCWVLGLWFCTTSGLIGVKSLRQGKEPLLSGFAVGMTLLTWTLFLGKLSNSSHLFQFVTTEWLLRGLAVAMTGCFDEMAVVPHLLILDLFHGRNLEPVAARVFRPELTNDTVCREDDPQIIGRLGYRSINGRTLVVIQGS